MAESDIAASDIVETVPSALIIRDRNLNITSANRAFYQMFRTSADETEGCLIYDLGNRQWDIPALRTLRGVASLTNEISHRIKNNVQIVVGLIAYEVKWTAAPCIQGYKAMQARIGAIAQLYDLISQSSRGRTVAVDAYLREIAKAMSASLIGNMSGIKIEVKAEPLEIDPDRAAPFALLVNELATNAIKHAFPHGTGHVVLGVEKVGDQVELIVADDGVGMKDKDSAKGPEKRGTDYVAIFVRQLGGTIAPSGAEGAGTVVRIRLPLFLVPPAGAERAAA